MRLFTLFISYRAGVHYCGVYPTLEYLYDVIHEMAGDEEIDKGEIPELETIRHKMTDSHSEDFCHEFSNGTWIQVQETSKQLIMAIKDAYDMLGEDDWSLVQQAVCNVQPRRPGKWPRWEAVKECLAVGSTTAITLCRQFRLDPDDQLDGPRCEH